MGTTNDRDGPFIYIFRSMILMVSMIFEEYTLLRHAWKVEPCQDTSLVDNQTNTVHYQMDGVDRRGPRPDPRRRVVNLGLGVPGSARPGSCREDKGGRGER